MSVVEIRTVKRCEHCFEPEEHGECPRCAPRLHRQRIEKLLQELVLAVRDLASVLKS